MEKYPTFMGQRRYAVKIIINIFMLLRFNMLENKLLFSFCLFYLQCSPFLEFMQLSSMCSSHMVP
jgi:hypothetical protein